jgi:hypothetical protein
MKCKYKNIDLYCYKCGDQYCKLPNGEYSNPMEIHVRYGDGDHWTPAPTNYCLNHKFEEER